jgi:predicted DNA-binding transcriptional regulator
MRLDAARRLQHEELPKLHARSLIARKILSEGWIRYYCSPDPSGGGVLVSRLSGFR